MNTRGRKLLLATPVVGVLLFVLAGCGFKAEMVDCTPTANGATYDIKVTSTETDKDVTASLLVSTYEGDTGVDAVDETLEPGKSYTFKADVPKGEKRWVGVMWRGLHGDGNFKYHEELPGEC